MTDDIEQKREELLKDVESVLGEIENVKGEKISYIRSNIRKARDQLDNGDEYGRNLRFVLHQIGQRPELDSQDSDDELLKQVQDLAENLEKRAALA